MPLPFALPVGLLLGLGLAWIGRTELSRSEVPLLLARPFLLATSLGLVVFAPILGYFVALHGDWAYLYLVRAARIPSAVDLVLVALGGLSVPAGFALAAEWAMAKRGTLLLRIGGAAAFLLVVLGALCFRRMGSSATFAQYHGGFGVTPLGQSPLGRGILLSWVALLAGFGWTVRLLVRR